jgi:tetratricopeptide (TPR) repeat protein
MGKLYQDQNDYAKAITYFARAEKIDPTKGEARFYRSLILLTRGQFKKGWALYEARFEKETWHTIYPYRLATPRWQGEPLDGKTIFVHSEQGFGDIIQFVRYLPLLKRRGGRVIFEVRPELVDLLRGFPGIDFLVPMAKKPPTQSGIDYHIPLLSLPGRFDTDIDTIPGTAPYLQADPVKVRTWQARVSPDHVNVGLVWLAKPSYRHNKSCPLEQFRALLAMPTVRVVGLQTFDNPQDRSGLATHITNWGEHFNSFADTAAAIHCLDLVIAVDTAVAHLAGALGRPVWTLLPFSADWRWLTERTDSPWYPSMTLYRQAAVDEWDEVVERIVTDMHRFKRAAG